VVLCIVLGIAYASALYYKERKNEFSLALKWVMATLRAVAVALIAFLLLNPMIKKVSRTSEKPVIIIAADNSQSIITGKDSSYYRNEFPKEIAAVADKLREKFNVKEYTFGDEVNQGLNINFTEKQTAFSSLFDEITTRFTNRNVGAMIIASDGIYNKGTNPLYASSGIGFPVYTIALGDTNIHKDIILNKVNYNRIAYKGNFFPVEVMVNAKKCKGLSSKVIITDGKEVVFSKNLSFKSDNDFKTVKLKLKADRTGMQHYKVRVLPVDGELSLTNNALDIFIDVLEGRQKILILANSPHPDISALKQAITSNKNYEAEDFIIDKFDKSVEGYNLVILHQLPSLAHSTDGILKRIQAQNIPVLFILGSQSGISMFNKLKTGFSIDGTRIIYNDALPVINPEFTLFSLSDKVLRAVQYFPPLLSPYGNYEVSPSVNVLLEQMIGIVETNYPLVLFNQTPYKKIGIINGEGVWKWRMYDFKKNGNHNAFNEIVNKIVQYLSVKVDKSLFRVYGKNNFKENGDIEFDAEVYNESYELVNESDVTLVITDNEGNRYPYTFNRTVRAYHLNAGSLPVGNYKYTARVNTNGKILTANGEFVISALNVETTNTIANHNLLYNLAVKRGGEMLFPSQIDELVSKIESRDDIKTIVYTQLRYIEILNLPWLLALIIGLLSIEWFMRKRAGGY
jgi:hypothetical protein